MRRFHVTATRFDGKVQTFTVSAPTQIHAESMVRLDVARFCGVGCNATAVEVRKAQKETK